MAKIKMKKGIWTTVTPLSKTLAFVLFIALPILAFFYGMHVGFDLDEALSAPAVETSYIR